MVLSPSSTVPLPLKGIPADLALVCGWLLVSMLLSPRLRHPEGLPGCLGSAASLGSRAVLGCPGADASRASSTSVTTWRIRGWLRNLLRLVVTQGGWHGAIHSVLRVHQVGLELRPVPKGVGQLWPLPWLRLSCSCRPQKTLQHTCQTTSHSLEHVFNMHLRMRPDGYA
jgi:hypothetical protein